MTEDHKLPTSRPRHILDLTTQEKIDFLNSFDNVFSDIDGVVWNLSHEIPNAAEGYKELANAGKKINYLTNNSVRPMQACQKKFTHLNMDVNVDEIIHPAKSIVSYLKSIKFTGLIYAIGTEMFKQYLRDAGFDMIDGPTEIIDESVTALAQRVFTNEPVRAVVIDVDFNMSSTKLIKAHVYLLHPECVLIQGATDMFLPVHKDINIIGPGPFAKILQDASKKEMTTLGKPGQALADIILQQYNIKDPKRNLMIGDMLEQDVGFGKRCGFQTLLVLSGGCKKDELDAQTNPDYLPDYYAQSMADFQELIKDVHKSRV